MINPFVDTLSNAILIVFLAFILLLAVICLMFIIAGIIILTIEGIKDWIEDWFL